MLWAGLKLMRLRASSIEDILRAKERVKLKLESMLTKTELEQAKADHHAKRKPIACGLTIHTGVGCNFGCLYCYVPDMGFPMKPRPYPLNGLQLVYALTLNPYFVPGPYGTLLAFGSVTEPFMRNTVEKTLEFLEYTYKFLGNPQQISTKAVLQDDELDKFLKSADPRISVLITITTLKHSKTLEPGAPHPAERLEFMEKLARRGVHVTLFLRPIIPSVTDRELREIIVQARDHGASAIVPGSLRVTPGIMARLKHSRIVDIRELEKRMPRAPRSGRDQVVLRMRDLKDEAVKIAREEGLRVLPSSCAANIEAHKLWCWLCGWGPCGDPKAAPVIYEDDVREIFEASNCMPRRVRVEDKSVAVECSRKPSEAMLLTLETLAKRRVYFRLYK